jgi:hypothetical protein
MRDPFERVSSLIVCRNCNAPIVPFSGDWHGGGGASSVPLLEASPCSADCVLLLGWIVLARGDRFEKRRLSTDAVNHRSTACLYAGIPLRTHIVALRRFANGGF